jgi:sugar/nucleoside kinase (ribokinase family)
MLMRRCKGVLWACSAGPLEVPAVPVLVVDTVGAGDAFNAGLAGALSEEKSTQHRETSYRMRIAPKSIFIMRRRSGPRLR